MLTSQRVHKKGSQITITQELHKSTFRNYQDIRRIYWHVYTGQALEALVHKINRLTLTQLLSAPGSRRPTPLAVTWKTTEIGCTQSQNIYSARKLKHRTRRGDESLHLELPHPPWGCHRCRSNSASDQEDRITILHLRGGPSKGHRCTNGDMDTQ